MRFSGVLLAAGESRRMGSQNKLLLPIGDIPLVRHAATTLLAGGLEEIVVVLGFEADAVSEALAELPVRTVLNDDYREGQATSVRAGLAALEQHVDGVMICLADQPALSAEDIRELQQAFAVRTRGQVLVPQFRGQRGNPIVLAHAGVDGILARDENFGCRQFVARNPELVATVEMGTDHVVRDLDRPEDYAAMRMD
jgi:molybdenum cofactor cytidylyltransferase